MDFKTLKTFQSIVKYGSFIRAAEEMNYVQSTVTMQIQKLEAELGMQLIERGKKIHLTAAGRLFYVQSLQIVKQMEQLQMNLADLAIGDAGDVRLGVTEPTASYRLPAVLASFFEQYPKIRISVEFASTPILSESLQKGNIDLALCSAPDWSSELDFEPLFKEEFVVLMQQDHPLAEQMLIQPDDLRGYRLLITSSTCPYRRKLEMVLQEAGSYPLDTMEIGSMTALPHYVAGGHGIALVPRIIVQSPPQGTTVRSLGGSLIDMTFGILSGPAEHPLTQAASRLYDYLKQELSEKSST
ncbi:LysR family transcriptional regulator [Paenibacillus marchantiophytorum]|uniref:LysR family transcriptional regulator n=1 Tax=Paenibacillus marchantiophytorum TaxID=1619310 RepID=A0ABQ1FD97_9BACL|nr:LysR family transcriptional regulator [Paenibacillus marchantiophytorum]GGA06129.1 LysR family transcriptional regulator [Paenibacillus marchantiophytorum]